MRKIHRPHHIVIGASTVMVIVSVMFGLLLSGKSRKARAEERAVIEIMLPATSEFSRAARLTVLANMDIAENDEVESPAAEPDPLSIDESPRPASMAIEGTSTAIAVRPGVELTSDLSEFAKTVGSFLSANRMQATITSGVRSSDHQLEIIKEKIVRAGMLRAFPNLMSATVADVDVWTPAWQWLKSRRIPVNPPASFVNQDGNEVGASLHTKGLALDMVSGNLNALAHALVKYANSPLAMGPLRITSLTRERDCVHVALTR